MQSQKVLPKISNNYSKGNTLMKFSDYF